MRRLGKIAPGSAAGDAGQLASIFRPKATVETKEAESCFLRPAMRSGGSVSVLVGRGAGFVGGVGLAATGGGDADVLPAAESASGARVTAESDPFGVTEGVASCVTPHAREANPSAAMPIEDRFIGKACCNVRTALSRGSSDNSRYESKRAIESG